MVEPPSASNMGRGPTGTAGNPNAIRKHFVKVVVIGDSFVGKTSLIQMFEHSRFTEHFKPTIGADFSNKEISLEEGVVILQIWDTAGQERFQSLSSAFYRGADCCCLVYDVTNPASFDHLLDWKQVFLTKSQPQNIDTFPFLVIGNKIDLEETRKVTTIEARKFCQQNGDMLFFESSAKNNINVEQAFKDLGALAVKRQMAINPSTGQPTGRMQDTKRMQLEAKNKAKEKQGCKC